METLTRSKIVDRCMFCDQVLEDQAYGFVRHTQETPECWELWRLWREFMHEDFGGS